MINLYSRADSRGKYPWCWVYFHGGVETLVNDKWNKKHPEEERCEPDLVSGSVPRDTLGDGSFQVNVYGTQCLLFLWTHGYILTDYGRLNDESLKLHTEENFPLPVGYRLMRHGLVIPSNDDELYDHAKKCMEERRAML